MTLPTPTLADFLLARIAEDEAVARSVREVEPKSGSNVFTSLSAPTGTVEMSPARVLAECEAKRRIVELHPLGDGYGARWDRDRVTGCLNCTRAGVDGEEIVTEGPCPTLRLLALPYADHADYREEWKR